MHLGNLDFGVNSEYALKDIYSVHPVNVKGFIIQYRPADPVMEDKRKLDNSFSAHALHFLSTLICLQVQFSLATESYEQNLLILNSQRADTTIINGTTEYSGCWSDRFFINNSHITTHASAICMDIILG